uniref:Immunoglobulin V-set domain-containing protein n=1 Tax=Otolemur garnettii TaxID=30611 RepID=H0XL08_OTOGA
TLRSDLDLGYYPIHWFQQKPGSPPRYLLSFKSDSNKHQGSGVPSRYSGSKDASAHAGILHISGLQAEDEADYYCLIWHDDSNAHTVLQTQGEVRQKPPVCSLDLMQSPLLVALTSSAQGELICIFFSLVPHWS